MNWPLMHGNISKSDLDEVKKIFDDDNPKLTQGPRVKQFETEWSKWLGVKHSIFVNSGSSANLLTLAALKILYPKGGEIIVPALTWSSDVVSVLKAGFTPKFVDIDLTTLGLNEKNIFNSINKNTIAIFLTHCQGYSALSNELLDLIKTKKIVLIEDVCESHGATHNNIKVGNFGLISNFSFYYAHHMTTIEGGMICTNDDELSDIFRCIRGHGLLREMANIEKIEKIKKENPLLNSDFIFLYEGFNVRNNEISATIGLNQIKSLNEKIKKRNENYFRFFDNLTNKNIYSDFKNDGLSNYAFNIISSYPDETFYKKVLKLFNELNIEYRRGSAGGGNQLRQPYLKNLKIDKPKLPVTDHVHFFGSYIGNFPELNYELIDYLVKRLNQL